ncbi:outer membrane beta-barrel domain-containing protein [Nannocystis pusilla]|uniref:Outer membrane beta-barrel domain-containing protein n=1 Tax=Nannocystis pusilla TaxID=889268 RepID=A0A9X3EK80_9BACT|nr:outer membrane beta-barrel domain-containing protein [Nannocystis pusilla]MCY1005537.1 outer membrane beta-barrel domain-containing protein [Nannocystis pusilla]
MRRSLTGSAVLLAAWAFTAPGTAAAAVAAPAPPAAPAPAAPADDDTIVLDEAEGEAPAKPAGDAKAGGEAGVSTDLFGDEKKKAPVTGEAGKVSATSEADQLKQDKAFITVVQRQRFLKKKRFELQPQIGITVNDPFVRHYTVGAELNYWITNRMAVGITGTAFFGNKTSRYTNIRFQESVLLTANKTLWQASVNFLYNPFYGKIAVFNRALMHWESYVQVGGGAIQTQVIPRYEAIHEPFRHLTGQGNFAIGARFYGPRVDWISVNFGVRTWIYQDKLEPPERGPGPNQLDSLDSADAAKDAAVKKLAFNVVFFLGLSFYFPTTFQYTTRR